MGKLKSNTLAKGGSLYGSLHDASSRAITAAVITCVMLMVATGLSFFLPVGIVLAVLFTPGLLTFAFGGALTRSHYSYNLSTNQKLAIERYMNADVETKKSFPKDWIETVRSASTTGTMDEDYKLALAAEKLVNAAKKRQQSLKLGNDKVEVALQILGEQTESLERDAESLQQIHGPSTMKQMAGRGTVEVPIPKRLRGRVQDR
jgi:hypothetical protein